ncbi:MAG TPA: hypothetical protein VFO16_01545 [Pseudonocardiaceae bacterium]|nr:hypothetical protein [Pseudonocardiaceae bacterium]
MEIKLVVVEVGPENYALRLGLADGDQIDLDSPGLTELGQGYRTPWQALSAVVGALTYQPPDTQTYDEAVQQVGVLLDANRDVGDAIRQLHERLQQAEVTIARLVQLAQQLTQPGMQQQQQLQSRGNPLLSPRAQPPQPMPQQMPQIPQQPFPQYALTQPHSPEPQGPPPPLRGSRDSRQTLGAGSHAGAITGGVARGRWAPGPPVPAVGEGDE